MVALKTFTFVSTLAGVALAHLQLQDPFPIKSPLNPAVGYQDKDYSYTAPLVSNGLPYPCKGYLDADASLRTSQKSWPAGSTQSFTIAPPGAIHGGGSCQLSLSYDMGKTWNVIWSYIGGCMAEDLTQSFAIPKEAPGGEAVFAWSWFNRQGNREMYHNCAVVTITNGGSGLNSRDYPAPFVANAGSVNSCSTIENIDPVFPNPGKTVKYSGGYKGQTPAGGQGITGSNCAHPGGADGAGTKASPGNAQQLVADPSSSAPASSASSSAHASSSSAVVNVVAPGATTSSSAAASSISLATSTTATPAASSTSSPTGAITASTAVSTTARKCKRRRSVPKSLIPPAGVKAHKDRRIRRHAARATTHAELARRASSGRVAAQKAEKPIYAD